MNRERLQEVIECLEKPLPSGVTFNMQKWTFAEGCGTAACAVGLYCLTHPKSPLKVTVPKGTEGKQGEPQFGSLLGWPAVKAYFDLTAEEALTLFDPWRHPEDVKPWDVAARIRRLLKGWNVTDEAQRYAAAALAD